MLHLLPGISLGSEREGGWDSLTPVCCRRKAIDTVTYIILTDVSGHYVLLITPLLTSCLKWLKWAAHNYFDDIIPWPQICRVWQFGALTYMLSLVTNLYGLSDCLILLNNGPDQVLLHTLTKDSCSWLIVLVLHDISRLWASLLSGFVLNWPCFNVWSSTTSCLLVFRPEKIFIVSRGLRISLNSNWITHACAYGCVPSERKVRACFNWRVSLQMDSCRWEHCQVERTHWPVVRMQRCWLLPAMQAKSLDWNIQFDLA